MITSAELLQEKLQSENHTISKSMELCRFAFISDLHLTSAIPVSRVDDYPETMLSKLKFLAERSRDWHFVILGGDVFHVKKMSWNFLMRAMAVFSSFECPVFTVIGNHDISYEDATTLAQSPLGVLVMSGVVRLLGEIRIPAVDLLVRGCHYGQNEFRLSEEDKKVKTKIVVAHAFWSTRFDLAMDAKEVIDPTAAGVGDWDVLLLGHDHVEYPNMRTGKAIVVRPGALARGTQHGYQLVRKVCYDVVVVSATTVDVLRQEVPVRPSKEVFAEKPASTESAGEKISDFVSRLMEDRVTQDTSVQGMVTELATDPAIRRVCIRYCTEHGVV